jgi:23S rRNA pseudouridine1911/1915/1917 synthase
MKWSGKENMDEPLYVDNHLLVLNKPANLLTQPDEREHLSLELLGKQWIKERYQKKGECFLQAIHRLDRPASGIVLFGRTSKAVSRLNGSLRAGSFQKQYLALVEGDVDQDTGVLEHFLKKTSFFTKVCPSEEGKKAILHFKVLQRREGKTYLEITLVTGRYHQIRAQLSAIGHPIVGDTKYGSKTPSETLFLHHHKLTFPHPITQEPLSIVSPPAWTIAE